MSFGFINRRNSRREEPSPTGRQTDPEFSQQVWAHLNNSRNNQLAPSEIKAHDELPSIPLFCQYHGPFSGPKTHCWVVTYRAHPQYSHVEARCPFVGCGQLIFEFDQGIILRALKLEFRLFMENRYDEPVLQACRNQGIRPTKTMFHQEVLARAFNLKVRGRPNRLVL